ncbi:retrovirus-related pol polyprotein from transposon TNT 1-94 [Tanacetum coccineum]
MYALTMSLTEPKNIKEAMLDHRWIESMQDELNQFKQLDVWELVPLPKGRHAFKIDLKTAFLNGPLKEEVFVIHLDGFVDPDFRNHVYHLKKALYGLKQAPRAWYDKLSSFLIENHFTKGILLRKHGMEKCDIVTTPMATAKIDADLQGTLTDQTKYHNMIGGLMYLTYSTWLNKSFQLLNLSPNFKALGDVTIMLCSKKTVSKVLDTKDTIIFKLDSQEIIYTDDIFRDTLQLPVETPDNQFVAPVNIEVIQSFMQRVGYHGVVDKTSGHDQTKINIPQLRHVVVNRTNVDYAALLWWDFMNCAFLTKEIRATNDYKEYETVFVNVVVPMNQPQLVVYTQGTHNTIPRAHRTPTLTVASPQGKKRKQSARETIQEKLEEEEEIEKMVEGDQDEESYASEFVDSMFNDDDDSGTRIEPGSYKENLKDVDDDETPIPTPTRSPRKDLSSDKTISEELTINVSPTTATTSKNKSKKGFTSNMTKILPGSITGMCRRRGQIHNHIKTKFVTHEFFVGKIREVLDHCNNVVPKMKFAKTNEMIKEEMPLLVHLAVNNDREIALTNVPKLIFKEFATHGPKMIEELFRKHMQNTTLNLYLTTSSSTAKISTVDLQQQLYLNMKSKPQDQAANPELWEILKAKFEEP